MNTKTISGHYDSIYSVAHNNRVIVSKNVDVLRFGNNYYCVAAGQSVSSETLEPQFLCDFWREYRTLADYYWEDRAIARQAEYERYRKSMQRLHELSKAWCAMPNDPVLAWIWLLTLPLRMPCGIYLTYQQRQVQKEWEDFKTTIHISDLCYKAQRTSLRQALLDHDRKNGTLYLQSLDCTVREMSEYAYGFTEQRELPNPVPRFATIEEIYDKVYEPAFRAFQEKQRPCRRYDGTCLEQIREKQVAAIKKKQSNKNSKRRTMCEALEIVFCIGDMDDTGYHKAPEDAVRAEALLRDFCDHLMMDSHLCAVTTRELEDPEWEPPFKNGLLVLNLTLHADEATPGVHFTCIPYASGITRGPEVQPAMGRALTGMGYPSTWQDELDDQGKPIPKRDKDGNVLHNKDGSIRYQQKPVRQGIVDWIEAQKVWIQQEMHRRYQWEREYKGSHPRGNLSIPDYQAARAAERIREAEKGFSAMIREYTQRVEDLTDQLGFHVDNSFTNTYEMDVIRRYLNICPEDEYQEILRNANDFLLSLPQKEETHVKLTLQEIIRLAEQKGKPVEKEKGVQHGVNKDRSFER